MLPGGTIRSALKTRLGEAGGYAVAITAALLCALLRLLVDPLLGNEAGLLLFVPAILAAAMAGGAGPTFVAATLSIGSSLAIARFHLDGDAVVRTVVFILIALSVGWLGSRMLRNGRELERFVGALHEREVRLQSILETIPDALVIIDERGAIDALSPAAERLFGWSGAELKGRNVALLMPEPDRSRHDAYLGRYLATGEKRVIGKGRVLIGQRCDGSTFPMQLAVGEMVLGSKRLFTGFVRDLTERQDADRRLRDVQGELLHVSRLASLGEMTSALAHELNQPLAAATSYMEGSLMLLERAPIDFQRLKAMIGQGGEQTWRAGEILRRMRDFSVRGETEQRIERLSPLLQEAAALALVGPETRDVRLSFQIDPAADAARIDKVQIQQVVVNLVRNGIEAMEGAADKSLALGTSPAANGMVEVWVSDRGAGLSEAAASTLFEPFQSTKPDGMGIGLSISRTIIEAHGGRIWADLNPVGGAVFRFTLPGVHAEAGSDV